MIRPFDFGYSKEYLLIYDTKKTHSAKRLAVSISTLLEFLISNLVFLISDFGFDLILST